MEQLLIYGLGVLTVLALAGVVSMFKSQRQIAALQDRVEYLERRVDQETEDLHKSQRADFDEVYRYIDSRTDRMESRIDARFNDNTAFVDGIFHTVDKLKKKVKETVS